MWRLKPRKQHGHIAGLVVAIITVVAAALLLLNRTYVVDQLTVWQFKPSNEVAALADRSGMNDSGKFYFYASQPAVLDEAAFNQQCDRKEEATAVLGCYNGRAIYIYNVTDAQLDGIKEVTAAHEMLHAVYARLNDSEKQRISALLETEYEKLKNDERWAERIAFYARTEPGERGNELHSMIGTEVRDLNPELEDYYKRYFADRSKVVALHEKYASVFESLKSRGEALSQQLTELGNQIEQATISYNADVNQLNADIDTFNRRAEGGEFLSQAEFQAVRSALLARVNDLESRRQTINADIARYTTLREELLSIASQSDALTRSLDSNLAPAPSL